MFTTPASTRRQIREHPNIGPTAGAAERRRPSPSRRRRIVTLGAVGLSIVPVAAVLFGALGTHEGNGLAPADGLDALCSAPTPTSFQVSSVAGAKSTLVRTQRNGAITTTSPQDLPVFNVGPTVDPGSAFVNTLTFGDVDPSGKPYGRWGWGARISTAASPFGFGAQLGKSPLESLFAGNFARPFDYRPNPFQPARGVGIVGLDADIENDRGSTILGDRLDIGGFIDLVMNDGSLQRYKVELGLDARPRTGVAADAARRLPTSARLSLGFIQGAEPGVNMLGVGLDFRFNSPTDPLNPAADPVAANMPPLGVSVKLQVVDANGVTAPSGRVLDTTLDFARAPQNLAIGLRQSCGANRTTSFSHLSLARPDAIDDAVAPATPLAPTDLDISLTALGGSGLPDPSGVAQPLARVAGRITAVPAQLDVILQPNNISITRNVDRVPDISPSIRLDQLTFAGDDPTTGNDVPLSVTGQIDGLPQHLLVRGPRRFAGFTSNSFSFDGWGLSCTGTPSGSDRSLPLFPAGCSRTTPAAVDRVLVSAQNFFPSDTVGNSGVTVAMPTLAECPATTSGTVPLSVSWRADLRPNVSLYRVGACARGIRGAFVDLGNGARSTMAINASLDRVAASDVRARIGVVLSDQTNLSRLDLSGTLKAVPAQLEATFGSTQRSVPVVENGSAFFRTTNVVDVAIAGAPTQLVVDDLAFSSGPVGGTQSLLLAARGTITGIPPHIRIGTTNRPGVAVEAARLEVCPTMATGDPFRLSGGQTAPCAALAAATAPGTIGDVDLKIQNAAFGTNPVDLPDLTPPALGAGAPSRFLTFASRGNRPDAPGDLFRGSIRIGGVRSVAFDLTGSGTNGNPATTTSRINISTKLAADVPTALIRVRVDGRTSVVESANTGVLISGATVATPVPATLNARFESIDLPLITADDTLAAIHWGGSAPVSLSWPTSVSSVLGADNVSLQLPGASAVMARGVVEAGSTILGRVAVVRSTPLAVAPTSRTKVTYQSFTPMIVKVGAAVSTATDRAPAGTSSDKRTRLRVDATVPATGIGPALVFTLTERNGAIAAIDGTLCTSTTSCAANRVSGAVHRGLPQADDTTLMNRPALPAVPSSGGSFPNPSALPLGPDGFGEGLRGVLLSDGTAGAEFGLRDIVSVSAQLDPDLSIRYRSARGATADPFGISVFTNVGGTPISADAKLSTLPNDIVVQLRSAGGDPSDPTPWLWVNTESIDVLTPPVIIASDAPRTGPRLDAMVLVGDQTRYRNLSPLSRVSTDPIGITADIGGAITGGKATVGFRTRVLVDLPRHIEVWKPVIEQCGGPTSSTPTCQSKQMYEPDRRTEVHIKAQTTGGNFGKLTGRFEVANGGQDLGGDFSVATVPAQLLFDVDLTQNVRLPWVDLNVDLATNVAPGTVTARVFDRCLPAYVGNSVASPENGQRLLPGQCVTAPSTFNQVPNYDLKLAGVGTDLAITARIRGAESPNSGPTIDLATCDNGYRARGQTRLGYLHADLSLVGVTKIDADVRVRRSTDPADSDGSQTAVKITTDGTIDGTIRAKLMNIVQSRRQVQAATDGLGALVGAIARVDVCLDMDLPLELTLTDVDQLLVRMGGGQLAIAPTGASATIVGNIRETFQCRATGQPSGCPAAGTLVRATGAQYSQRVSRLEVRAFSSLVQLANFVENDTTPTINSIGILDVTTSRPGDACSAANSEPCAGENFRSSTFTASSTATKFLLDPVWSAGKRSGGEGFYNSDIGGSFYNALLDTSILPPNANLPSLRIHSLSAPFSVTASGTVIPGNEDDRAFVFATDGTRYRLIMRAGGNGCIPQLQAWHTTSSFAREQIRWVRDLAIVGDDHVIHDELFETCASIKYQITMTPRADGSIQVDLDDLAGTAGDSFSLLDASGIGVSRRGAPGTPIVPESLTASNGLVYLPNVSPNQVGTIYATGTGEQVTSTYDGRFFRYPSAGTYLATALTYKPDGKVDQIRQYRVTVPSDPI